MSYPPGPQQPESYPPPPPGEGPYGYGDERQPPKRPGTLLAACIMTWVGSGLGLLLGLLFLAFSGNDEFLDEVATADMSRSEAATFFQNFGGALVVASLLALAFSIIAFTGKRWAAIALVVLGALWVALSLYNVATSGNAQGVVAIVYVGVASALVLIGSKDWFDHKAGRARS